MFAISIDQNFDWESINQRVNSGDALVLSKNDLLIGIKTFKVKKNKKYTCIVSSYSQEEDMENFFKLLQKKHSIEKQFTVKSVNELCDIITKIVKLYDRWNKLSILM